MTVPYADQVEFYILSALLIGAVLFAIWPRPRA